ncbi:Gfo/Idh/MocA family protein [Gynuella sunshinyii]|uniref:Putative dehydrogenase-related protein n=1 Tax=Gynuella sunshinyii YC6258 TaxID=1445510 RepID=A0A0C5VVP9_9GAMM|nr:Gfo/Idh/MocA family oxidoreductase [Gynuella sunshinyii]AJQ97383.1 putative dehydrogenase-related protein [Gynuella sunshinyii YC6258]
MNQPLNDSSIKKVKWGIIGTANIARNAIVPALQASPWCEIQAVASRNMDKSKDFAAEFYIPVAYDSYDEILDDPDVEAVYIPLPNHLHLQYALKAAQKGKHVLCEKPITMNAEEAKQLREVPDGIIVAEAFMVRHHPQWHKLRQLIRSGQYGQVRNMQAMFSISLDKPDDFRFKPEFGGGAIYDLGCYTTMSARYVFEQEPERVFCSVIRDPASQVDMTANAILDFGNGRRATFTVSMEMAASQRLQVICEQALIDLPAPYVPGTQHPAEIWVSETGDLTEMLMRPVEVDQVAQYENEVTNFAKAVRGEISQEYAVEDAIRQMQVIDALFASAATETWQSVL